MIHKYNIDNLDYIYSLKHKRKAVVYYDKQKYKYIDVNSNSIMANRNERTYKNILLLGSFNEILSKYGLQVLLINSQGQKINEVSAAVINNLIDVFERIRSFNDSIIKKIEDKASLVTNICINNLRVSKEEEITLRKKLYDYIFIDIAINGMTNRQLIMRKEDKMIDYKILRVLKYLGINICAKDIPNFKIEYNLENITYFDSKGNKTTDYNLDKEEEKVKKIVDKRTI